ncbi:MAG: hypothetical protein LBM93_10460 [Oscillospiraceae bacterium]|nr:hypothetical protein [Oscillospiraceae bacterium]
MEITIFGIICTVVGVVCDIIMKTMSERSSVKREVINNFIKEERNPKIIELKKYFKDLENFESKDFDSKAEEIIVYYNTLVNGEKERIILVKYLKNNNLEFDILYIFEILEPHIMEKRSDKFDKFGKENYHYAINFEILYNELNSKK